jgi:acyl-CoA-binding protein
MARRYHGAGGASLKSLYHRAMDLSAKFEDAQVRVKKLAKTPSTDELLELYALYKQATAGDVSGSRPGMLDMKGRAKYDAWAKKKGASKDDAMTKYVALVDRLAGC